MLFISMAEDLNSGLPTNKSRSERDLNPGPQDRESDTLTTWPRYLQHALEWVSVVAQWCMALDLKSGGY